jgi:transposase-like protein
MSKPERRRFSREFKWKVIERLEAGESGTARALELSIKRTIIYRWRDLWRQGRAAALPGKPGPRTKAEALELERARGVAARNRAARGVGASAALAPWSRSSSGSMAANRTGNSA